MSSLSIADRDDRSVWSPEPLPGRVGGLELFLRRLRLLSALAGGALTLYLSAYVVLVGSDHGSTPSGTLSGFVVIILLLAVSRMATSAVDRVKESPASIGVDLSGSHWESSEKLEMRGDSPIADVADLSAVLNRYITADGVNLAVLIDENDGIDAAGLPIVRRNNVAHCFYVESLLEVLTYRVPGSSPDYAADFFVQFFREFHTRREQLDLLLEGFRGGRLRHALIDPERGAVTYHDLPYSLSLYALTIRQQAVAGLRTDADRLADTITVKLGADAGSARETTPDDEATSGARLVLPSLVSGQRPLEVEVGGPRRADLESLLSDYISEGGMNMAVLIDEASGRAVRSASRVKISYSADCFESKELGETLAYRLPEFPADHIDRDAADFFSDFIREFHFRRRDIDVLREGFSGGRLRHALLDPERGAITFHDLPYSLSLYGLTIRQQAVGQLRIDADRLAEAITVKLGADS